MGLKWTRGSRKHRIGRAHARFVIETAQPLRTPGGGRQGHDRLTFVGPDDRGIELEVVAIDVAKDQLLVIHVMPTALRRRRPQ